MRKLLVSMVLGCALGISVESAEAAVTTYSNRSSWQAAAGSVTTIDFSTNDSGNPITSPTTDAGFASLSLSGVEFLNVRSYWNLSIYVFPDRPLRANLPPGTVAFGADIKPFYNVAGDYTVTLSTGDVFTFNSAFIPWTYDFFGVTSSAPVEWVEFKYNNTYLMLDNFSFKVQSVLSASVDIKPDSPHNNINPNSNAVVPVAILSTQVLDASQIDVSSVRFGVTGSEASAHSYSLEDVNGDGVVDLLVTFRVRESGIVCGTTEAIATGQLQSGQQFSGSDLVNTVGCK